MKHVSGELINIDKIPSPSKKSIEIGQINPKSVGCPRPQAPYVNSCNLPASIN